MRKFIPRPCPRFFVAGKIFHKLIWEVTRCHSDNFDPACDRMIVEVAVDGESFNVHLQGERPGAGSVFSTCSVRHGVRLPPIAGFYKWTAHVLGLSFDGVSWDCVGAPFTTFPLTGHTKKLKLLRIPEVAKGSEE
jgi:hypothetical protein